MGVRSAYLPGAVTILRFILGGLLVAALFYTLGCSTTRRTTSGEPIYFTRTAAYERKLATLRLTEAQARDRIAK